MDLGFGFEGEERISWKKTQSHAWSSCWLSDPRKVARGVKVEALPGLTVTEESGLEGPEGGWGGRWWRILVTLTALLDILKGCLLGRHWLDWPRGGGSTAKAPPQNKQKYFLIFRKNILDIKNIWSDNAGIFILRSKFLSSVSAVVRWVFVVPPSLPRVVRSDPPPPLSTGHHLEHWTLLGLDTGLLLNTYKLL